MERGRLRESFNANSGRGFGIGYERGQVYGRSAPHIISPTRQVRGIAHAVGDQAEAIQRGLENIFAPKDAPNKYNILDRSHNDGSGPGQYRGGLDPRDAGHRTTGRRFFGRQDSFVVGESGTVTRSNGSGNDLSTKPTIMDAATGRMISEKEFVERNRTPEDYKSNPEAAAALLRMGEDAKLDARSRALRAAQTQGGPSAAPAAEVKADANAGPPPPPPVPTQAEIDRGNAEEAERKKAATPGVDNARFSGPNKLAEQSNNTPETTVMEPADPNYRPGKAISAEGIQNTDDLLNQFSSQGYKIIKVGQGTENATYAALDANLKVIGGIAVKDSKNEKGIYLDPNEIEARLAQSGKTVADVESDAAKFYKHTSAVAAAPAAPAPEAPKQAVSVEAKGGITL